MNDPSGARPNALYTLGHGTRTLDELHEVLAAAGVRRVVDVRRYPGSRRHPHFGRDALAPALRGRDVDYDWRGDTLGGRRTGRTPSRHPAWREPAFRAYADHMDTGEFRDALDALLAEVAAGPPLAVMCAETLWWRCHRRLIADAATLAGTRVLHIGVGGGGAAGAEEHRLPPSVRADERGRPVYDVGCDLGML